jgi:hypothetical protein
MTAAAVLDAFPEEQRCEDWMGGNLNDSLLFHRLIVTFDQHGSYGPLPEARLEQMVLHQREDATLYGTPLDAWDERSLRDRLSRDGHVVDATTDGCLGITGKLEISFGKSGKIERVEIYLG